MKLVLVWYALKISKDPNGTTTKKRKKKKKRYLRKPDKWRIKEEDTGLKNLLQCHL